MPNLCDPPAVWWAGKDWVLVSTVSLLIWGHGYAVSFRLRVAQQHEQANERCFWRITGPASASHLISHLHPVVSPLTSGYLTAKTNCLAEKTHNSPCTLLIYTRLVSTCKYGKSIWTVWCHLYTLYPSLTAQRRHYLNLFCVIEFIFLFCYTSSFWEKGKFESCSCLMHFFFNKMDNLTEKFIRKPDYGSCLCY